MPTPTAVVTKNVGPCVQLPVLMYHHIQDEAVAKKLGQTGLTVSTEWFEKQMNYLRQKGYEIVDQKTLIEIFNGGKQIKKKLAAVTLDDAYEDNYVSAFPIIKKYNIRATIFTPSGLVNVPGYLTWGEIDEMKGSGLVEFANHTWSHHGANGSKEILEKEISLADGQLAEKGLNTYKIFAYPYGRPSVGAEAVLKKYGYQVAFTTRHGQQLCQQQRYELPRIRVGNAPLSSYGL